MNEIIHTTLCGKPTTVQIAIDEEAYSELSLSEDEDLKREVDEGNVLLLKAIIMMYSADRVRWFFDSCLDGIEVEKGTKREMITEVMEHLRIDDQ